MYNIRAIRPILTSDLVRVGRMEDGGYVINERILKEAHFLLSFGINTDWSFEKDFYRRNKNILIEAYDFSIDQTFFFQESFNRFKQALKFMRPRYILDAVHLIRLGLDFRFFFGKRNIEFKNQGIDAKRNGRFITFADLFSRTPASEAKKIFVKMDIEGYEYKVCEEMLDFSDKMLGFIIEFHDLDERSEDFDRLIKKIKAKNFVVTHVHANNAGGVIQGSRLPRLLEISFAKEHLFTPQELEMQNKHTYPLSGIDFPCIRDLPELVIPFND